MRARALAVTAALVAWEVVGSVRVCEGAGDVPGALFLEVERVIAHLHAKVAHLSPGPPSPQLFPFRALPELPHALPELPHALPELPHEKLFLVRTKKNGMY